MARNKKTGNSGDLFDTPYDQTRGKRAHGKKVGPGTVHVSRGKKVPGAERGVGQATIDGFINGSNKRTTKRARGITK